MKKFHASQMTQEKVALRGRWTGRLVFSVFAITLGSFVSGYNVGVVNTAGPTIKRWIAENLIENCSNVSDVVFLDSLSMDDQTKVTLIWSFVVGLFPLGAMFGSLTTRMVADKIGRKCGTLLNNCLTFVGGIVMAISKYTGYYWVLMVGRLIIGVNCGLNFGLTPMYLTELAPINYRGMVGSTHSLMFTVAILISNILGLPYLLGTNDSWPFLLIFTVVPSVMQLLTLPFCPESPKYLLVTKRETEKAWQALTYLRQTDEVSGEIEYMQREVEKSKLLPKVRFFDLFRQLTLRWNLFVAVALMLGVQFSGINAELFYSREIFATGKLSPTESNFATLGMMGLMVLMMVLATTFVDLLGRRALLLTSIAGMWIANILQTVSLHLTLTRHLTWASYMSIPSIYLFIIFFFIGYAIPSFFVSESFNQNSRGYANSVAVAVNWFVAAIVGFTFPHLQNHLHEYAFVLFAICLTAHFFFVWKFFPESKGKTVDQVSAEMQRRRRSFSVNSAKVNTISQSV